MPARSPFFILSILLVLAAAPLAAVDASLPRHPAPSPDASLIAFSWQGDIWLVPATGGQARRLTANPADERYPAWSRDGRWLAFASDRHGSADVFVMPADASLAPRRLTFASRDDIPLDFTPDGSAVLFRSPRAESVRWMQGLYTVPVDGGTPVLVQQALARWAAYAPDGRLAFVRGCTKWYRRHYQGPANREIWLRSGDEEYRQLTDFDGTDDYPSWIGDHTLAFQSSRVPGRESEAGRKNLFTLDIDSQEVIQLTRYDGSAVRAPRASANGELIAFEYEDALWTIPATGGQPTRLAIEAPADRVNNLVERRIATRGADELAISPDGTLAAFVLDGEIFVTEILSEADLQIAPPLTLQVTRTPAREQDLSWSPDGKRLLFTSAAAGNDDICIARPADAEAGWTDSFTFTVDPLTDSPAREYQARYSPDGSRIAYLRDRGDLLVMAVDGSGQQVLLESWSQPVFHWSPDGAWLAYAVEDLSFNSDVWIVAASGGTPYNVSRHPDDDLAPRWSPDGRRLLWLSARHADTLDVWGAWLTRADHERTDAEWLKLFRQQETPKPQQGDGSEKKKGPGDDSETEPELPHVTIEFDGLWRRVIAITDEQGDEGSPVVTPNGRTVIFSADHEGEVDLYRLVWGADEVERLTTGGQEPTHLQLDREGETVFFIDKDGVIKRIDLEGEEGDPVPFEARYQVDLQARRGEVLDEAWRTLDQSFYHPQMHGVDWPVARRTYRPWALAASSDQDFADMVNLMIGELDASHLGYYPKDPVGGEETGWIGAVFTTVDESGALVQEVLRDSPAAAVAVNLVPGERLVAVDGVEISPTTNIYSLFTDTVGRRVRLVIVDQQGSRRQAVVIPVDFDHLERLRYDHWVWQRRAMVDRLSDGRLGYLHIESMDMPSLEELEWHLYAAANGKEGLIIDVRSNGGGWTTDYLMAVLMVRRHAFTVPRGADPDQRAYPQSRLPLAAWTRPALTICNEESYSNAEIFSHAFKTLQRGKLLGTATFGAVISTGARELLDGGRVRVPFRGWYVAGSGRNMEEGGAEPDPGLQVAQPPGEDTSGEHDTQLQRAVEVLLDGIENDPRYNAW